MQVGKDIMSLHHQERSHFRLSTLEDIKYLAPRLRQEDKQEILACTGLFPYEVLLRGFKNSVIVFTILNPKNKLNIYSEIAAFLAIKSTSLFNLSEECAFTQVHSISY